MSSDQLAIKLEHISKHYQIYANPRDRLKQFILPLVQRLLGRPPKRYFHDFRAVDDVTFEIRKGQTVGIIGRNGSGKSTLLQMICGTLTPTGGSVHSNGRIAALLELGSGFNPEFTGRENVFLNASILGLSNEETAVRFDDIVAFADIGEFIEQPVKTYSSGMMLRLAFAVIAHVDADILVVDEALAVGDAFFTQKCMRFLRDFMQDRTVLFVSHDTGSIRSLCSHVVWLEKGKVIQEGPPKDVCESYLEAFFEARQGKSSTTTLKRSRTATENVPIKDQRLDFINTSNLRNDLKIFSFDPNAASFGKGGAAIENVALLNVEGPLAWVVGGEKVTLHVVVRAFQDLEAPIVGFYVKDRLGQTLFGDNTYLSHRDAQLSFPQEGELFADFMFYMPILPAGDYSINVAVANGTQSDHEQHHWIHDAVVFRSESSSVSTGLIGIPMLSIEMGLLN
jgi:lipopolysaccharide transport system ATP-binding protein